MIHPQEARRLEYETTATSVLEYAQILIPAPLQTPGYTATVILDFSGRFGAQFHSDLR